MNKNASKMANKLIFISFVEFEITNTFASKVLHFF